MTALTLDSRLGAVQVGEGQKKQLKSATHPAKMEEIAMGVAGR